MVAATLLDLKAARLLPAGDVEDEEDLALLEARDLLFARLLQYRAYKQVAAVLRGADGRARPAASRGRSGWRSGSPTLLPEVLIGLGLDEFAALAARRWRPSRCREVVARRTCTPPRSASREQAAVVVDRLRRQGDDDLPRARAPTRRTP